MQKNKVITITQIKDVYELVNKATAVDGDIVLQRGKYAVDGKSILGIFSLDLTQPINITYPEDAVDFEQYISAFEV